MPLAALSTIFRLSNPAKTSGLSKFAWKLMQAEERRAAIRSQRMITVLIATMVPAFSILDYFAYPEHFELFAVLRVICTVCALALYSIIKSKLGKRCYRIFTVALPLVPAFFISLMVLLSQDPGTPYYAGLTLCIVAIGFVFHWTYREAFFGSVAIAVMYLIASSPAVMNGMDTKTAASFVNNCIFIAAQGIVIVSGCFVQHKYRIKEFVMRERSRQQKIKLRAQKEALLRALSDLNQTEDQLIQSEKMASLGQLSAGVIHEIGNPLNYSNQALFLLRKRLKKIDHDDEIDEVVGDIQESLNRMKDIVKDLRDFSHKSSEVKNHYSLRESVEVAVRVLGKEIDDSNTELVLNLESNDVIKGVKNQVTQVLINLIHNAIQAMESGTPDRKHCIEVSIVDSANSVGLIVRDNGPGITEEVRNHIFDPFYTTKEVGEGTGLGLSISFRIIESHQGKVQVLSELGAFTEFRIQFPRAEVSVSQNHHSPLALKERPPIPIYNEDSVF
tara:strand:+ start:1841 stop:3346 length:1506 start_codon:yes stop_codon:yes gene_type:complete